MSTTLTNGLKLPDKGSVDWYADMQSNYTILDGAVGTVAEHTTQIAGKAPLVHTHTKSDVTDLFNSANTWTALNSYNQSIQITANFDIGTVPSSDVYGGFNFGNGTSNIGNITSRINSSGATYSRLYIGNKFANGALDPNGTWKYVELQVGLRANGDRFIYTDGLWRNSLIPYDSTVSIGDSNHQWNNLYAKNYYYNGVAWGLDKANVWSGDNTFTGRTSYVGIYDKFQTTAFDVRTDPESTRGGDIFRFWSGTGSTFGDYLGGMSFYQSADGSLTLQLICFGYPQTGNSAQNRINFHSARDGTSDFYPVKNNNINLGTSTSKWKTLNGINPGALSLPKEEYADVDISAQGLNWDLTGSSDNSYTPNRDGWLEIWAKRTSLPTAYISVGNAYVRQVSEATVFNFACVTCPVRNGQTYTVRVLADECHVRIIKAEGNV